MNCNKCRNAMEDDAKFCGVCGEAVVEKDAVATEDVAGGSATIREMAENVAPAKKSSFPKLLVACIVAALVIVGTIVAAVALLGSGDKGKGGKNNVGFSGEGNELNVALANSVDAYTEELKLLASGNAVLNALSKLEDNCRVLADVAGFAQVEMKANGKTGEGSLSISAPILTSAAFDLFVTKDNLTVGSERIAYFNLPVKAMADAIESFLRLNKDFFGFDNEYIAAMVEMLDMSVGAISESLAGSAEMQEQMKALHGEAFAMIDKLIAEQEIVKAASTIEIGGALKNCNLLTMELDEAAIAKWLLEDVFLVLETNETLKEIIEMAEAQQIAAGDTSITAGETYATFLEGIEDAKAEIADWKNDGYENVVKMEFSVYDGVIVAVKVIPIEDGYEYGSMTASALGKNYRLEDICFTMDEDTTVRVYGQYINTNKFEMNAELTEYGYTNTASVIWDVQGSGDNLQVKVDGENIFSCKLALVNKDVVMEIAIPNIGKVSCTIGAFDGKIAVPSKVVQIAEFDLSRMEDFVGEAGMAELQSLMGLITMLVSSF